MKRRGLKKSTDRKRFKKTSAPHKSNLTVSSVMRGGIRK